MNSKFQAPARAKALAALAVLAAGCGSVQADDNTFKLGVTRYTTNASTNGIAGVGVPVGADATVGNATALLFIYERMVTPNIGAEVVLGIPPRIHANAAGSVAFLGNDVLSAKIIAPTAFINYHFGTAGDAWRPYVGVGINYTKFINVKSNLAPDPKLGDSTGLAVQAGVDYNINAKWGVFASVARLDVKSKLVAAGATVLTSTIDFKPVTFTAGLSYKF